MNLNEYKVGDKVLFGRRSGEMTLGEVVRLGRTKIKVKQMESRGTLRSYPVGTIWTVPPSLCRKVDGATVPKSAPVATPVARRPEAAILKDIQGCYAALSPENVWMDGEASPTEAARYTASQKARLRSLFAEMGREVSESEAFGLPVLPRASSAKSAKDSGLKRGDKVTFNVKSGETVVGFVRRVNAKTVTVDPIGAPGGAYWRVSPRICKVI